MKRPPKLSQSQAELLMSQLLDGELAAKDAERLQAHLEAEPGAIDWMESLDAARHATAPVPKSSRAPSAVASISQAIEAEAPRASAGTPGKLLSFPRLLRPLAAAATVALVASLTWMGIESRSGPPHLEASVVEFVATDLPDASTYIYSDDESGWTVVWVESSVVESESRG